MEKQITPIHVAVQRAPNSKNNLEKNKVKGFKFSDY